MSFSPISAAKMPSLPTHGGASVECRELRRRHRQQKVGLGQDCPAGVGADEDLQHPIDRARFVLEERDHLANVHAAPQVVERRERRRVVAESLLLNPAEDPGSFFEIEDVADLVHARAWLDAGRRTAKVDLTAATVDFVR